MVYFLVVTSLDQLLLIMKILFTFLTKQANLMRRSTVFPQLLFPAFCMNNYAKTNN